MLGKCYTTRLHPQPVFCYCCLFIFYFLRECHAEGSGRSGISISFKSKVLESLFPLLFLSPLTSDYQQTKQTLTHFLTSLPHILVQATFSSELWHLLDSHLAPHGLSPQRSQRIHVKHPCQTISLFCSKSSSGFKIQFPDSSALALSTQHTGPLLPQHFRLRPLHLLQALGVGQVCSLVSLRPLLRRCLP